MRPAPLSMRSLMAIITLPLLGGCGAMEFFNPGACTLEARPGISVRVRDAATGAHAASGAAMTVRDGDYRDSSWVMPTGLENDQYPLSAAHERPGTYQVTVRKTGYRDWVRDGVVVRDGRCHVETAELTASLER